MTTAFRALTAGLTAAVTLAMPPVAEAQSTSSPTSTASSSTFSRELSGASSRQGKTFIDIAIGKAHYATSCGNVEGLSCSNNVTSYSVTAGRLFNPYFGAQLTWLDFGRAHRADGNVSARGLNFSAVGSLPLGDWVSLQGKIGPTFGITKVSAEPLSGLQEGKEKSVGLGYGAGLDLHFARGLRGGLGWERHDFKFEGQGRSHVSNVTLSLGYAF